MTRRHRRGLPYWAASRRSQGKAGAAKSGQKLPQITPVPVGSNKSNGSKQWDEMLDTEGIDFSQDLEFGDGATVRISPVPLSPQPKEPPLATAAPKTATTAARCSSRCCCCRSKVGASQIERAKHQIEAKCQQIGQIAGEVAETNGPAWPTANSADKQQQQQEQQQQQSVDRKVEVKVWGKPAKTVAPAKTDDAGDASPNTRWWKASLSGGCTSSSTARNNNSSDI
ncbi:hypothetical protein DL89DRAFT_262967 [Linderina pennispora]|uniref:Uncharacterized protein n=1 Tax=Linderina pennispora TaxID=61395 RepID=A0A1Y1VRU3_9FUNG|nr:uncharacterized protein DL89DRAFT_262967 [Linderina pennispora]ORX63903.1 hypothetical protein DL89DRAFT_262967 [Linderina pennispora]